jgi:hypothetical protein
MGTVLIVCAIVVTVTCIVVAIFLIRTLLQMYRTAQQAEMLLRGVNEEVEHFKQLAGNIFSFADKFTSPWFKAGSWLFSIAAAAIKKKIEKKSANPNS